MAHKCYDFWGAEAGKLTKLLDERTLEERKAAVKSGGKTAKRRLYEGWIHRFKDQADYDAVVRLYYELCLAVKQPTDIPNHFGRSALGAAVGDIDAKPIGDLARAVAAGLAKDGGDKDEKSGALVHSDDGTARFGTPNWLEKPPTLKNHDILVAARSLLRALRAALSR